jgi:hypothetical protein
VLPLWFALWLAMSVTAAFSQDVSSSQPVLNERVARFEVIDRTMVESVAQFSSERLPLNLGFEAVLKKKTSDPATDPRFTLKLEDKTVREILDALCAMDNRYTWSSDPSGVNMFPRATIGDATYFLNRQIDQLDISSASDPYDALTPLVRLFPAEQLAYAHLGGSVNFSQPWTATFKQLTVREFMNRLATHLGPSAGWTFYGADDGRWFNFHKGPYSVLGAH